MYSIHTVKAVEQSRGQIQREWTFPAHTTFQTYHTNALDTIVSLRVYTPAGFRYQYLSVPRDGTLEIYADEQPLPDEQPVNGGNPDVPATPTSFDAAEWAEKFIQTLQNNSGVITLDLMLGWFANAINRGFDEGFSNAIMRGFDEGVRRSQKDCAEQLEKDRAQYAERLKSYETQIKELLADVEQIQALRKGRW